MPMPSPTISPRADRRLRAALPLVAALCAPMAAAQPIVVEEPRAFGHVVGDLVERRIRITLPAGAALDREALPRPGRTGAWLELREVRVAEPAAGQADLRLTYQLVNAPVKVTTIALPALALRLSGGAAAPLEVGPWPITAAPITPEFVLARAGLEAMQPDIAPVPEPLAPIAGRLAAYLALAAAAGFVLAARRWPRLAFWRREAPFRDALPELRRLARRGGDAADRAALARLHRAFDESAGCALFADRLAPLYAARPRLRALAPAIEAFYAASRAAFFAPAPGPAAIDAAALLALCRRLAREEGR